MQPNCPRKLKLALFDLDGTLTVEKSAWEYIHRRLGVWTGDAEKFQAAFLRGEISYDQFCRLDAAVWKGMKVAEVLGILQEIPFHPGVEDLVAYLREKDVRLGIISSGLSFLSERVKERFGFDYAVANDLGAEDGILTGDIDIHVQYDQKAEWVEDARRKFGVEREEVLAIGDSSGDVPLFQRCGMSIAFNCHSPQLKSVATFCSTGKDLRHLISILTPYLGSPGESMNPGLSGILET
jgi:phosphoserine phosphatase